MTDSEVVFHNRLRRAKTALALLTATAALAGGTQALTPSPAEAMINLGDCANLSGPALFECEMRGAGAGSGSGGGGGGSTSADAGDQIIGEPIYVSGTRPSHCQLSPSSCLPSMPGGRHQIGSDGVRPRGPRPGGHRPVRVGEVEKEKEKTKEECALLQKKIAALEEAEIQEGRRVDAARQHIYDARDLWISAVNERSRLSGVLDDFDPSQLAWAGLVLRGLEKRYAKVQANIEDLERRIRLAYQDLDQAKSARTNLSARRRDDLSLFSNGGCRWRG